MKPSEHLRAGRAKIAAGGLAKVAFARDARGFAVHLSDPSAVSYCMNGAIAAVSNNDTRGYVTANRYMARCVPPCYRYRPFDDNRCPVVYFSDNFANQRAALALYDCAIELAESEGR